MVAKMSSEEYTLIFWLASSTAVGDSITVSYRTIVLMSDRSSIGGIVHGDKWTEKEKEEE